MYDIMVTTCICSAYWTIIVSQLSYDCVSSYIEF